MANDCFPLFDAGAKPTCHCEAAVTGKRFVEVSGPMVNGLIQISHATAAGTVFGVAFRDTAIAGTCGVYTDGIVPVTAGGAFSAGQLLEVGADGKAVVLAAGIPVAKAMSDGVNNADAFVQLLRTPA